MATDDPASLPAVAVLGAGSWGTALAALIARHGHRTVLWGRDAAAIDALNATHENARYLPGVALPSSLGATHDLSTALQGCDARAQRFVSRQRKVEAAAESVRVQADEVSFRVD